MHKREFYRDKNLCMVMLVLCTTRLGSKVYSVVGSDKVNVTMLFQSLQLEPALTFLTNHKAENAQVEVLPHWVPEVSRLDSSTSSRESKAHMPSADKDGYDWTFLSILHKVCVYRRQIEKESVIAHQLSEDGFVAVPERGNDRFFWRGVFVELFVPETAQVEVKHHEEVDVDEDDILFFVPANTPQGKQPVNVSANSGRTDVLFARRRDQVGDVLLTDMENISGSEIINWEATFYLNLVLRRFTYTYTVATAVSVPLTAKPSGAIVPIHLITRKVHASPSFHRMDLDKGSGTELTYPKIFFPVEYFDEIFKDVTLKADQFIAVKLAVFVPLHKFSTLGRRASADHHYGPSGFQAIVSPSAASSSLPTPTSSSSSSTSLYSSSTSSSASSSSLSASAASSSSSSSSSASSSASSSSVPSRTSSNAGQYKVVLFQGKVDYPLVLNAFMTKRTSTIIPFSEPSKLKNEYLMLQGPNNVAEAQLAIRLRHPDAYKTRGETIDQAAWAAAAGVKSVVQGQKTVKESWATLQDWMWGKKGEEEPQMKNPDLVPQLTYVNLQVDTIVEKVLAGFLDYFESFKITFPASIVVPSGSSDSSSPPISNDAISSVDVQSVSDIASSLISNNKETSPASNNQESSLDSVSASELPLAQSSDSSHISNSSKSSSLDSSLSASNSELAPTIMSTVPISSVRDITSDSASSLETREEAVTPPGGLSVSDKVTESDSLTVHVNGEKLAEESHSEI